MKVSISLFIFALAMRLAFAVDLPPNPEKVTPGMERGAWSLEGWGNSGAAEKVTFDNRKILKLIYSSDGKDKASFKHLTYVGLDTKGKIRLHVYAPDEKPPKFGLAVSTTKAFRWHENQQFTLKKGWNKIEVDVRGKGWKTEASKWEHKAELHPADDVRAISLLIFNGEQQGTLYVDGLTYDPDETGRKVAALIKDLQSDDMEARAVAEKKLVDIGRPATEALYQVADDDRPEVLLRAASALRQIEESPEELPTDPAVRVEVEKQREEQRFDEARRRADYVLNGLNDQRAKLFLLAREAQAELAVGRAGLDGLKHVDMEKRKAYVEVLARIDAAIKDTQPLVERVLSDKKADDEKKAAELKAAVEDLDRKKKERETSKEMKPAEEKKMMAPDAPKMELKEGGKAMEAPKMMEAEKK
ncbi:MAG TPA: hypothetical protein VEJ63_16900 [Planctomycetota bacterium]|nr:hypothetical protein [Planctomycetota bacterium]